MRQTGILLIIALFGAVAVSAAGSQDKFGSQITSLLMMKTKAGDAVDSALSVLQDLKQANVDSQTKADQLNKEQVEECASTTAQLKGIVNDNKNVADDATKHREFIDQEIKDTNDYIQWVNNRQNSISEKRRQLEEQRCASNAFFIRALKEHSEAIEVFGLLKKDLAPHTSNPSANSFSSIRSVTDKLSAYSHLFNVQAVKAFSQLSQAQAVSDSSFEWNNNATDNSRDALKLEAALDGSGERNTKVSLGDKLEDIIDRLIAQFKLSIEDLTHNEVQSAWDLVAWMSESEKEIKHLNEELARKAAYLEKLSIAFQSATSHEQTSWRIHAQSVAVLVSYVADCQAKADFYAKESSRRSSENFILQDVIQVFSERVSTINSNIRDRVNDYSDNKQLDNENFERATESQVNRDAGRVAVNVEAESRN